MTDDREPTNGSEPSPGERRVLAALEIKDPQSATGEEVDREALEIAGLLAYSVEPLAGDPELRARILGKIGVLSEVGHVEPSTPGGAREPRVVPFPVAAGSGSSSARWLRLLAAAALLAALGLAALSGLLYARLEQSEELVTALEAELGARSPLLSQTEVAVDRISVVASPTVRICPLASQDPNQPSAQGMVYMKPDDGKWVLAAANLKPCEKGRQYQLWFVTSSGVQHAGSFHLPESGPSRVELAADEMPSDLQAVKVTLEWPDASLERPEGQTVLYGDRAHQLVEQRPIL